MSEPLSSKSAMFDRLPRLKLLFLLVISACPFFSAAADQLEVLSRDTGDRYVVDLADGERGRLVVYLKSFGDEMQGYTIELVDDLDRTVASQVSTAVGIIQFDGLPAGRFRIKANPEGKKSVRNVKNPVTVADFRLTKVPASTTK